MLSEFFSREEFERSGAAEARGIKNAMGATDLAASVRLCRVVLDPLRRHLARPVRITSGYRSPAVNLAIGNAAPSSQHTRGEAADIEVTGMTSTQLFDTIRALGLPVDQLINEFPPDGWVHVSYRTPSPTGKDRNRGECLRATKRAGTTVYTPVP